MIDVKEHIDAYLSAFEKLEKGASLGARAWIHPVRERAIARFAEMGLPTTRDEAWKYTSVAPIAKLPFQVQARHERDGLTAESLDDIAFGSWEAARLVFVNGHYAPELSKVRRVPDGVKVLSLAEAAASHRDLIEPHLARYAGFETRAFAALNTAFMSDGALVHLPDRAIVADPIHLLFLSAPRDGATVSQPRTLVLAGAGSQAAIVETYAGSGGAYFTNAVTEIVAGERALLDHYKMEREGEEGLHVATMQVHMDSGAAFTSHSVSLGGSLVRNDVDVLLGGEGCDCTLNGLFVISGRQHVDNHTVIDHARPHGSSRELYKGVLGGRSRGVFDGKIIVRKDAQKTDARQVNKNLLLSEEALMDTKPQLEINADDVKCTHAATIGQLDPDSMFYLRARGIGVEEARSLLMQGFVSDITGRIRIEPLRKGLESLLRSRLTGGGRAEERR